MRSASSPFAGYDALAVSCAPSCDLFDLLIELNRINAIKSRATASPTPPSRVPPASSPQSSTCEPLVSARSSPPVSRPPSAGHKSLAVNAKIETKELIPIRAAASPGERDYPELNQSAKLALVRANSSFPSCYPDSIERHDEDEAFKKEVIKDLLSQVDYWTAWRHGVVEPHQEELAAEMRQLSTRALSAWSEAFLYIRSELLSSGYEMRGFKALPQPHDTIREMIDADPNFDLRDYVF